MPETAEQNFANHRMIVPTFHFVLTGLLLLNLIGTLAVFLWGLTAEFGPGFAWMTFTPLVLAAAMVLVFIHMRTFATGLQERIIRLEMQVRLRQILPDDLKGRIGELTKPQYIGLRFASDAELPDLMREALDNGIDNADEIKKKVKDWQADHWRI